MPNVNVPPSPSLPTELRTERLLLRPWRADDAAELLPVLQANVERLRPWIPARVAEPVPEPVLAERLAGFAADFAADREWRFGMFLLDRRQMLGEVGLFPRSASGRVPLTNADRAELGYWIRADAAGLGYVTEAARAILDLAATFPAFSHVEIRCDARNVRSVAVPRRLGFVLATTIAEPSPAPALNIQLQVWTSALAARTATTSS